MMPGPPQVLGWAGEQVVSQRRLFSIGKIPNLPLGQVRRRLPTLFCACMGFFALAMALGKASAAQHADGIADRSNDPAPALVDAPEAQLADQSAVPGSIHGVIAEKDGTVCEGAHVALTLKVANSTSGSLSGLAPVREAISDASGRFTFVDVPPGPFQITVTSAGFIPETVMATLLPGQAYEVSQITMTMQETTSEIQVTASQEQIAQAQLKVEEQQRVLGVLPNFYVSYAPDAAPLNKRQKFGLAWHSVTDPATFLFVGIFAGIEQADNTFSGYGQGGQGYAKRFGAGYTDQLTGTMIGQGILASWWKQDPRYFYKGSGSARSRALYAIAMAVMCKGDSGHWQVNYSAIVGGLASGGISNLYYPASNRSGAGLTFENALIGTGESAISNLFQEFVVRKLTPHLPNYSANKP